MKDSKRIINTRRVLEAKKGETVDAVLDLVREDEQEEKWISRRSWIGTITGVIALLVSILVALLK